MKEAIDFASALQLASKTLQFYSGEHPRAVEAIDAVEQACAAMLSNVSRIAITSAMGTLLIDGEPYKPLPPQAKQLAAELQKRDIGGIIIAQGATRRELAVLTSVIGLRREQLKQRGGDDIFREADVTHIRLSHVRYEAITEGEEVVWSKSVRRNDSGAIDDPDVLPALLQKYLLSRLDDGGTAGAGDGGTEETAGSGAAGKQAGAAIGDAAGTGELTGDTGTGVGDAPGAGDAAAVGAGAHKLAAALTEALAGTGPIPASRALAMLQSALTGLEPVAQIALIASLDRLPVGPARDALKSASSTLLLSAVSGGTPLDATSAAEPVDVIASLARALAKPDKELELLSDRLADLGVSREQLDEILGIVSWEKLTTPEKMAKLLAGDQIFEFPPHKLLDFFRELLETGLHGELQELLEHYARGLEQPSFFIRQTVCDTFAQVTTFIRKPGLPATIEQFIGRVILNHFVREEDPRMKSTVASAAATFMSALVATSRSGTALRVLSRLDAAVGVAPADSQLHPAREALRQAFGEAEYAHGLLQQVGQCDTETLARDVLPLVAQLGDVLAAHIIEALGNEEDRNRRGRLVRALKAIGSPAFPVLLESLQAPTWYVVRNTLSVLADIGTPEHVQAIGKTLAHGDPRVRRAAARALGRIGGFDAEALLVGAVNDKNSETQSEVFVCLGNLKAQSAIGALADLARARLLGNEKVRDLAITTLGQIGSDAAIPPLTEILRPKGLFGRDTNQMRGAAARALAAIGSDASRAALKAAAAAESDRAMRELITRLVGA